MRLRVVAVVLSVAALVAASPAGAKGRTVATLTTEIPLNAEPGRHLRVAWTLMSHEDGQRRPFNASGVFVRLLSRSGGAAAEGFADSRAHVNGEYEATVVVPDGGIGDIEIGLQGWSSGPTGTQRSDLLFPITNDPITPPRMASPTPEPSSSSGSDSTSLTPIMVVALVLAAALSLGAVGLIRRRSPRTTVTPQP